VALGLANQRLVVNGVFQASDRSDATAASLEDQGTRALAEMLASLRALPRDDRTRSYRGPNIIITLPLPLPLKHKNEKGSTASGDHQHWQSYISTVASGRATLAQNKRKSMLKKLILAAGLAVSLIVPAYAADPQTFKTEDSATKFCKTGNVVWFNPESKIYFPPGSQFYGKDQGRRVHLPRVRG
jgi:hypothetical protein